MRSACSTILIIALSVASSDGFTLPGAFIKGRCSRRSNLFGTSEDLHEFDYLLNEKGPASGGNVRSISRRVVLPDSSMSQVTMTSASSTTMDADEAALGGDDQMAGGELSQEGETSGAERRLTYREYQQGTRIEPESKVVTLNEIALGVVVPGIIVFTLIRSIVRRTSRNYSKSKDEALNSFIEDMIYNDGDVEGLRRCKKEYGAKLLFLGPARDDIMLKRYIEVYSRRKTVTPETLSSMSYVISLFGLSEVQFAKAVISVCRDLGEDDTISTGGRLLFFANRILKSPEGRDALSPGRKILKAAYGDDGLGADILIESSEIAMAEGGYRATIEAKGENHSSLPSGWEILGLSKERAEEIYNEEREGGFANSIEAEYAEKLVEYSDSGEPLGELAASDDEDPSPAEEESPGQIMECQNCGYTIFIAKGRDQKFFGADFKCPQCGAAKDQMKARDISEDEL